MPSIDEVRAQIAKIDSSKWHSGDMLVRRGVRQTMERLPDIIREDERILDAVLGAVDYEGAGHLKYGLIVATNKRLICIGFQILLAGGGLNSTPYHVVSSVDHNVGIMFGSITVHSPSGAIQIGAIRKRWAPSFAEHLRGLVAAARAIPLTPAVPDRAADRADEIRKLAALRDEGILTEDEFTGRKRQLLGLE